MKSALAQAKDKWFFSDDGKECSHGMVTGKYLQNRLERAYLAGANYSSERIEELEEALSAIWPFIEEEFPKGLDDNHGTCASDSYLLAAREVEQALKG